MELLKEHSKACSPSAELLRLLVREEPNFLLLWWDGRGREDLDLRTKSHSPLVSKALRMSANFLREARGDLGRADALGGGAFSLESRRFRSPRLLLLSPLSFSKLLANE